MKITDVTWSRDHQGHPVLELRLDGHPAYIRSSQRSDLTGRGIVEGVVFLKSERVAVLPNPFISGDRARASGDAGLDLVGCTDDPVVFALYQARCEAIRAGTWRAGPRPAPGDRAA